MTIDAPDKIGRYEITDLVGEGGMGRVYRARDTQLGRTVAIKVLPQIFAIDRDRLRRFEQEAQATAALSHPGVLALYDFGTFEGAPYIVSELLDGTTLRARLDAERLSTRASVGIAIQIADALAAAHEKGIIHRDLKPDNVFVTAQDRIKILDFGLAKLTVREPVGPDDADLTLPPGTVANTILGTPGYMSPEQARAQPADHRSDIFSFGCILYEMLQGQRAFSGETPTDVLSAVLKEAPPPLLSSVERPIAPALDGIAQRCLAKDPGGRFQSASDLAFALRAVQPGSDIRSDSPSPSTAAVKPASRAPLIVMAVVALAAAAIGAALGWFLRSSPDGPSTSAVTEFLVPTPTADHVFASMPLPGLLPTAPQAGVSPDGRLLAFVSTDATGLRRLWLRSQGDSRPRALDGTDGATSWPFWSPDSKSVVFAARRSLVKLDVTTGTSERICSLPDEAPPQPFVTGTWNAGGTILFSIGGPAGLYRVQAAGGRPEALTTLDAPRGDQYHSWPQLLPDDRYLFFVRTNDRETNGMYAGRLGSPDVTLVLANASRAVYGSGHLLWLSETRLVAQPFDTSRLQLTGQRATVVPSVFEGAGRTPGFWASNAGVIAYATGDTRERQFRTFDRLGHAVANVGPPGYYITFDTLPDLSRIVAEIIREGTSYSTLATFDVSSGVLAPLTLGDRHDSDPRYGPNGDVVFARNTRDSPGIVRISPAGPVPSTIFPRGQLPVIWVEDWASDGSSVVFRSGANRDAWLLAGGATEPVRLTDSREPIEQVQLSPDGSLISYSTSESGRQEVFVAPVPFTGERWQISIDGGVQPNWRADGRELYYLGLDGGLYAVAVDRAQRAVKTGRPERLFSTTLPVISSVVEQYRPSGDGQRFLFCLPLTSVQREPLRMLLNWPERLK
jgi:serine/threonine protein kinase